MIRSFIAATTALALYLPAFGWTALAVVTLFSLVSMAMPFMRRFREASLWLRGGYTVACLVSLAWVGLGVYLAIHQKGGKPRLSWPRFLYFSQLQAIIGGIAMGIFACLVSSPEFRARSRRAKTSNKSLQPTAGRSDV